MPPTTPESLKMGIHYCTHIPFKKIAVICEKYNPILDANRMYEILTHALLGYNKYTNQRINVGYKERDNNHVG